MNALIDRLITLEQEIRYRIPPPPGLPEFVYEPGSLPVLLSAPHGAAHIREGEHKPEDEYTAAFARLLASLTGAHALYTCYQSDTDPNYYAGVPYKQTLQQVIARLNIRFVLDLHGARPENPFGLALGTMRSVSCPDHRALILDTLSHAGFRAGAADLQRLDVDSAFPAAGSRTRETITRFVWRTLGVAAAQLEINAYLRIPRRLPGASQSQPFSGDPEGITRVLRTLQRLIPALINR